MRHRHWWAKARNGALILALSVALSACFDLTQKVEIGRSGAGHYQVEVSAAGIVGEALKEKPAQIEKLDHATTITRDENGRVTQISTVAFDSLSGLQLSGEAMSLHVLDHSFFGLGPDEVRFRRIVHVDQARKANAGRMNGQDDAGTQILASIFGDHSYTFAVTLPGSITRIAPVKVANVTVTPTVTGDFYHGHTITWTMPLYMMLTEKSLTFEVDFSAYGSFGDVQTAPGGEAAL